MISTTNEKRNNSRISAVFNARVAKNVIGETIDISDSGLCLGIEKSLGKSLMTSVEIDFPFSSSISTTAELVWMKPTSEQDNFVYGVQFMRLKEEEKQILQEAIEKKELINKEIIRLVIATRKYLLETKRQFDKFDGTNPSLEKQMAFINKNREEFFRELTDHFEKAWDVYNTLSDKKEKDLHQKYYQQMLGCFLLDAVETNRYIISKPLGYAGDFVTMNYIFNYNSKESHLGNSTFENLVNNFTCNIPISKSNIARKNFLKEKLLEVIKARAHPKILSVGAGSIRELFELIEEEKITKPIDFFCLDFEEKAVEFVHREMDKIPEYKKENLKIKYEVVNIKNVLTNRFSNTDRYDFIYCSGLYDYLVDKIAIRLTSILFDLLKKDGTLILINADKKNGSHRMYYEILGDWRFIHRKRRDLLNWVKEIPSNKLIKFEDVPLGKCYHYLSIKRSEF